MDNENLENLTETDDLYDSESALEHDGAEMEASHVTEAPQPAGITLTELDLKVKIQPDTLKKLKILAILSSYAVVEQLKIQLEEQVNHAFDALISEEMMKQLKSSGMINENIKISAQDGSAPEHELSDDEEEPQEELGTDFSGAIAPPKIRGRIIPPDDVEAEKLKPPAARFKNVDTDADAYLDTIFGNSEQSEELDRPAIRNKKTKPSEDALIAQAAGLYQQDAKVSKASKSFSGGKPRVSVRGFDGDEDSLF